MVFYKHVTIAIKNTWVRQVVLKILLLKNTTDTGNYNHKSTVALNFLKNRHEYGPPMIS